MADSAEISSGGTKKASAPTDKTRMDGPAPSVPISQDRPDPNAEGFSLDPAAATVDLPGDPDAGAGKPAEPSSFLYRFGNYKLVEEIGHGGMGVVYRAWDPRLGRYVALKMIRAGQLASDADVQRFHKEAKAAAQLVHPGIVCIYEVDQHQGQHYYVMELVDGGSLMARVRENPLPPRKAAEMMQQVSQAVAYAHSRGIIHRDLKPANILLTQNEQPKIADFGLAKIVHDDSHLTLSGQVVGTPAYMGPEQAAGRSQEAGPAADVYSLGATLYCLLTGRPPFQAASSTETLRQVLDREPVSPRQLNADVDRDLETICLKCLQKETGKRYPSAEALAEDLGLWLSGKPIKARPVSWLGRCWRWCRRNKLAASLVAACVLSLLAGTAVSLTLALLKEIEAQRAEQARQLSDARLYVSNIQLAHEELKQGLIGSVEQRLERLDPQKRGFEWDYLQRQCHLDLRTIVAHDGIVWSLAFSPDGRWLASGGQDKKVRLWEMATGREVWTRLAHRSPIGSVAFSRCGRWLASAGGDETVILWDVANGRINRALPIHGGAARLAFNAADRCLAVACMDKRIRIVDPDSGAVLREWLHGQGVALGIAYSPDGHLIATAGSDWSVKIWEARTGRLVQPLSGHGGNVYSVAFSPDGRFLVSAGADMNVKVWDARGWRLIDTKYGHTNVVAGVAFSRDSRRLLTASNDQTVKLWEPAAGREIMTLRGHRHPVWSAAFSPDGWRLASGDGRGTIKIWDGTSSHECISLTDPALDGRRVVISPDGKCLATYGTYSEKVVWEQLWTSLTGKRLTTARRYPVVQVWDVATGRPRLTLRGHTQPVRCAAFAAGTGQLISASGDGSRPGLPLAGELIVWDATTGNELRRRGAADIVAMSCSHDGRRLATVGWDRVVRVWDTARWEETMSLPRLEEPVQDVALSPDGSWLAACSGRGVWVWNAQTGQQVHHLHEPGEQPGGQINELTFSPDSRWIATAESAGPAKIWDVAAGQVIHRLHPRHETGFQSVAFSPDGRRLVTASNGPDAVTIWDLFTRQEILTLARPGDFYDYVAVSPDGRQLAALAFHHENTSTGSAVRHSIRIWDTEPGTVGDVAQREAGSLVQFLFAQCNSRREVLRAIDDQRSISEPVRERARGLVEQYRERP